MITGTNSGKNKSGDLFTHNGSKVAVLKLQ